MTQQVSISFLLLLQMWQKCNHACGSSCYHAANAKQVTEPSSASEICLHGSKSRHKHGCASATSEEATERNAKWVCFAFVAVLIDTLHWCCTAIAVRKPVSRIKPLPVAIVNTFMQTHLLDSKA